MHFFLDGASDLFSQRCIAYSLCEGGSVLYIVLLWCGILVICNHSSNGSSHASKIVFGFGLFKSRGESMRKTENQIPIKLNSCVACKSFISS